MRIDLPGRALAAVFLARILLPAQRFLLFGVYRDRRMTGASVRLDATVDVSKLGVSIRMIFPFSRFAIGLQAVSGRAQQFTHFTAPDTESLPAQFAGQVPQTFAGPTQWRLRVAARGGLDQRFKRRRQSWLLEFSAPPSGALFSLPTWTKRRRRAQFPDSVANRPIRLACRRRHRGNTAAAKRHRFGSGPTTSALSAAARRYRCGRHKP